MILCYLIESKSKPLYLWIPSFERSFILNTLCWGFILFAAQIILIKY